MVLNECYSIPNRYVRELAQYDPLLRLRWAKGERLVRLERQVTRALPYLADILPDTEVDEDTARRLFDDLQTMKEGYQLITKFAPGDSQWPKVLYTVVISDIQRLGGARAVATQLEDREAFERSRRQWNRRDDFRHMASDLYRHMNTIKTCPEGAGHKAYGGF